MNTIEFLEKLGILYKGDEENSVYRERICMYANLLDKKLKEKNREADFDATIEYISENYAFRAFPTFNYILDNLKYKPCENKKTFPSNVKLRGFRVKTDIGVYDFWDYLPKDEVVTSVRGFTDIEEITCEE